MDETNQVVPETSEAPKQERDMYIELRNTVIETREKYRRQLLEVKEKLAAGEKERAMLITLRDKLEGAIEASDFYSKAVLPTNNKPR
jgi:hypothetical protein